MPRRPSARISAATVSAASSSTSEMSTFMPSRAKASAMPRPMPLPPPVITAFLPLNSCIVVPPWRRPQPRRIRVCAVAIKITGRRAPAGTQEGAMYELYYWPAIQGRGEFVRLALEAAGAAYIDVARAPLDQGGGVPAMQRLLQNPDVARPPFAPPFLKSGDLLIGETANILAYLGPRHNLAPI